ncbi:hypothetical protein L484_005062 [Morus notabilis]|uniref:3-oxoacyl-[acyl-carrier-protein] reductase FabG n=1 Tax=Morus notabilis TaxID=981085 RepID=W9QME1_9ROSA|nr:hypothetical protein L484_005062 [Morus notabilis]
MASEHQLEPWHDLSGKVGCHVIATTRRVDRLKSLYDQINNVVLPTQSSSVDLRGVVVELDVCADGPTIEKSVVQKAWEAFGRIDALINNAGFRGFCFVLINNAGFRGFCFVLINRASERRLRS